MANNLWDQIIKKWHNDNIPIRPGVSSEDIAAFESKNQVVLAHDVREYFSMVDGTGDHMTEDWHYRFWPLAEVKPVHDELDARNSDRLAYPDCFVFADHLISSWIYAVRLTQDANQSAPVFQIGGGYPRGEAMADSFRQFMCRYAEDDKNIV